MLSAAMLLIVLILLLLYLDSRKPKGFPPGPKWWPIFGCLFEVSRLRRETGYLVKTFTALSRRHGNIVGLRIGKTRLVVLNDHESAQAILTNQDCDGRPMGLLYDMRTWGVRRGIAMVDDDLWIEQRKFVLKQLRELGYGRVDMIAIIEDEAMKLVEYFKRRLDAREANGEKENSEHSNRYCAAVEEADLRAKKNGQIYRLRVKEEAEERKGEGGSSSNRCKENGKREAERKVSAADMYVKAEEYDEVRRVSRSPGMIITMHDAFGGTVLNTLWKMLADKRFELDDEELRYFQGMVNKVFRELDMSGAAFNHFPILRFIAPELSGYRSFSKSHERFRRYLQDELNRHKNTINLDEPRDLIDVYLSVLKSENHSPAFSEDQLMAISMDLYMAGSETTSMCLSFCFLYLLLYPHVQRKAQEEIDRVIGRDKLPTISDRPRMVYINAIVLESLRMFMGRTLNMPHRAMKDIDVMGYRIPKDTMIIVNFEKMLMDESWGDPDIFRPERFIDKAGNIHVPHMYNPFGLGRHRCLGESLARSNLFIITAVLLQHFTFSVVPGEKKPTVYQFRDGVTAAPLPFRAMVRHRT
ncbi:hypothetical protein KM043_010572 [Ampulex compressa]|nr:hypothetical protein KM043_010572 [Ampulex compressa]